MRIWPDRGARRPLATLRTVDLPAPLGPTRQTTVPAGTFTVRPRRTSAARPYPACMSFSSSRNSDAKVCLKDSAIGLDHRRRALRDRATTVEDDDVVT